MNFLDKAGVGLLWSICKLKFALAEHTHTLSQIKDAGAAASKSVKTASGATSADWVGPAVNNNIVPTMTFIAYWNGAYNSDGNSNLQYCSKGKFGTIVTKNAGDYAAASHTHSWSQVTGAPSTATRWPSWGEVTGKPSSFTPSSHTHDDRYYTQSQINSQLKTKAESVFLASDTDLNTVLTPGFYSCGGSNSVLNKPSGVNAIGLIVTHNASGSYYTQILNNEANSNTYRRTCLNGKWSAWTQDKYTDTNTWRGIQNNLTSNSTSDSLSAAQGKVLKGLIDSKANSSDLSSYAKKSQAITSIDITLTGDTHSGYTQSILPKYANNILGVETTIKNASFDTDGFMSRKDKSKLDGIQSGANKYTLPVASTTTLGGIKVTTKATGTQWPICVNNDGLACTKIDGLINNSNGSVESVFTNDLNNNTFARYSNDRIIAGHNESDQQADLYFPTKSGIFALTSDCLSIKKGSAHPNLNTNFNIEFTSAQQIVLLDQSGSYNISQWYEYSYVGDVLDMYPCGLQGGVLRSDQKGLFYVMEATPGGPALTTKDTFSMAYNIHIRLIHIDKGILVCPYDLKY